MNFFCTSFGKMRCKLHYFVQNNVQIVHGTVQCWKMSGSASSTAARKCFTKYLRRKFLSSYILECHIIYLLFKNSKSILQVDIVLCRDWSWSQCAAPYVLGNLPHACRKFNICLIYTENFYFWILLPGREIYILGLLHTVNSNPEKHQCTI
jgi:hypothetical protein